MHNIVHEELHKTSIPSSISDMAKIPIGWNYVNYLRDIKWGQFVKPLNLLWPNVSDLTGLFQWVDVALSIDLFRLITGAQKCRSHALCVGKKVLLMLRFLSQESYKEAAWGVVGVLSVDGALFSWLHRRTYSCCISFWVLLEMTQCLQSSVIVKFSLHSDRYDVMRTVLAGFIRRKCWRNWQRCVWAKRYYVFQMELIV